MTCRIEPVGAASWRFCPDALPVEGARLRALVQARLFDEITGLPVEGATVATLDARLAPRSAAGGIVGLAGRPLELFPDLGAAGVPLPLTVGAPGYLARTLPGMLGPILGFPDNFAPLDHGDVALHRIGVAFNGRVVVRATPANLLLAGAVVEIDGTWPTAPPPDVPLGAVMQPARLSALLPRLYRDRPAATLARCDFVPDPANAKALLLPAPAGSTRLRLHDRRTLAVGMPLLLDDPDPGRREVLAIASIDTSLSDDQPAWIELAYPLAALHRERALAVPASVPLTHDARALARPALAGDPLAFLAATAPWPDFALIIVDDGVNAPEYHWPQHYAAVAGADADFRLPPLARLALFRLRVTHPTQPNPLLLTVEPDYGLAEQDLLAAFE